ncbi:hypothetical protein [Streptomyces sp. NPDC054842]
MGRHSLPDGYGAGGADPRLRARRGEVGAGGEDEGGRGIAAATGGSAHGSANLTRPLGVSGGFLAAGNRH